MFERYTEKARRVVFFARYETSQLGATQIEPEHLLLGILREDHPLISIWTDPAEMVRELRAVTPAVGEKISTSVDLPLSHSAKRTLAYGAEEMERLGQKHIDTGHLLLGLLREKHQGQAILHKHGISLEGVREKLIRGISAADQKFAVVRALRDAFTPIASRLTGEIEPAVIFSLKQGGDK